MNTATTTAAAHVDMALRTRGAGGRERHNVLFNVHIHRLTQKKNRQGKNRNQMRVREVKEGNDGSKVWSGIG